MSTEKASGKLVRIAGNKKGFQLDGFPNQWFNATKTTAPYLEKTPIGTVIEVEYFTKGAFRNVTKITALTVSASTQQAPAQKQQKPVEVSKPNALPPKEDIESIVKPTIAFGSPEDIAGKEVGCATNAAATILSGRQEDPATLLDMFRTLMNGILDHIRAQK